MGPVAAAAAAAAAADAAAAASPGGAGRTTVDYPSFDTLVQAFNPSQSYKQVPFAAMRATGRGGPTTATGSDIFFLSAASELAGGAAHAVEEDGATAGAAAMPVDAAAPVVLEDDDEAVRLEVDVGRMQDEIARALLSDDDDDDEEEDSLDLEEEGAAAGDVPSMATILAGLQAAMVCQCRHGSRQAARRRARSWRQPVSGDGDERGGLDCH